MQFLHHWIEFQAKSRPDAIALVFEGDSLTYSVLNRQANQWAQRLRTMGVGPDSRVALCFDRGFDLIVALLAALKAGGAYVPLDPGYPTERLAFMLADSDAQVVLAQRDFVARLTQTVAPILVFEHEVVQQHEASGSSSDPVVPDLTPTHLAYVIYTSGSTGRPKGVLNHHAGLINLLPQLADQFHIDPTSRVLQFASPSFDASVLEVAMALCHGATLCLASREAMLPGDPLLKTLRRHHVTHLTVPPSALSVLAPDAEMASVQTLTVAGEAVATSLVRHWAGRHRMINIYGPTETTIYVTAHHCDPKQQGGTPIGRPVGNVPIHILDAQLQQVDQGTAGEIYVGGPAVSRGYLGRPDLTAERFVPDPFCGEPGGRMYKTGDLGRYLPDGSIEFLGRTDHQVKLRGFRIELGEIEARLGVCEGVREAVVLAREDTPGDKRLVAYYTAGVAAGDGVDAQPAARRNAEALREQLAAQLPEYMVPAAFVALPAMPLTPNGKVDRKALPAPDANAFASREFEAPVGEIETALARIWSEVLGLERIGRRDNFFELGGHSLLAVRVASRVQQRLGIELELGELFHKPELGALAQALQSAARSALPPIARVAREQPLALSFAQQRLWFLAQMEGVSQAYHIARGMRLVGALDGAAMKRTLDRIMARHEALRTTFIALDGQPAQHIAPPDIGFALQHHDLRGRGDASNELQRLIEQEATAAFDLEAGPLIRGRLIQLSDAEHVLLLTMHHIVSDGWSMEVLADELSALYGAFSRGREDPLPALQIQYADFAAWQRRWLSGAVLQTQSEYWQRTLAGAPELLELPTDRPRPQRQDHAGGVLEFGFDQTLSAGLKALGQRHGATLFMTLLAAWGTVLARLSGQAEVVIATPVANRRRIELEPLIGFFVNTLALRLDTSGSPSVVQWLERAKAQVLAAQQHQDLPFEQVVEIMRPVRSLAHSPLFQVMFVWEGQKAPLPELPGLGLEEVGASQTIAKFDLTLFLREQEGRIAGAVEYATALFDRATVQRHVEYLRCIAKAMVANEAQAIDRLQILPEAERHKLLVEWNDTKVAYPDQKCVHELFEAQVARDPNAIAVRKGESQLSYGELNAKANQLAHRLIALGVKPDDRVAILVERSLEMVVGLLATLKAGGAYLPLDPAYPAQRLAYMLEDSAPRVILTQGRLWASVHKRWSAQQAASLASTPVLDLESHSPDWARESTLDLPKDALGLTPHHLAYVIYTSGSTGQPKAAEVTHRGMRNVIGWYVDDLGMRRDDAMLLVTSYSFDLTQKNIYGPFVVGATLNLADEPFDPRHIVGQIERDRITTFNLTPSAFHLLVEADVKGSLGRVRRVVLGGEPIQVAQLLKVRSPRPEFINGYGPTECSGVVASFRLSADLEQYANASVPLGKPIRNLSVYVLDIHGDPVPVGARGEIYISGHGVGPGYSNRPDLTAERFVPDPFCGEPGGRMYKTGDLGRYLPDGSIEFLGRTDHQVKLRGFRIELGEIEARLGVCEGVREAVVLAREDTPGDKRLVAYYTAGVAAGDGVDAQPAARRNAEALREQLAAQLPEYMVPAAFVALPAMPLTPNGKVDRKALPAPDANAFASREFEAPVGEIETALARIWSEVLGLERIGRRDNFFELGGHSLLAVRVASRVQQRLGIELELGELFHKPELGALAQALQSAARSALPPIARVAREQPLALSFAQQRLWFLAQMEGVSQAYHIARGMRLVGALDGAAMKRTLDRIMARHEALRTTFIALDGQPAQHIAPPDIGFALQHHDLRGRGDASNELQRLIEQEATAAFDLEAGPLIRGRLIQLSDAEHVLLLTMHHIVSDGWSMEVLADELSALYGAFSRGREDPLPALQIQYADFAAWQRRWLSGAVLQTQSEYWQRTLAGAPELLELPTDRPRPQRQDHAGGVLEFGFDQTLSAGLKALGQRHGATLFMTLLAAWGTVLARLSGQAEVVIATPVANRRRIELEPLIGFFVNTLALRLDTSGSPSVVQWLERAKAQVLAAQQHQDLPFEQVVEIMRPVRSLAHSPLFQVMFVWEGQKAPLPELPGLGLEEVGASQTIAKFDLTLFLREQEGRIAGAVEYATALFDRATVQRHVEYLRCIAKAMVANEAQAIDRLQILPEAERHKLLVEWNDTKVAYPDQKCVHELFEAQVARDPNAIAVRKGESQLSYGELNAKANQLAHRLIALGVKPDDRVAILVERSLEMVVGLLATLKAGGAYLPLDPAYPAQRLAYMLEDSAPRVILTQGRLWASVHKRWSAQQAASLASTPVLDLESHSPDWARESTLDLPKDALGLTPHHLAYVIYTSGSTGQPKGVAMPHKPLVNLLHWQAEGSDAALLPRTLQFAALGFDVSFQEVFGTLSIGAELVLIDNDLRLDFRRLLQHIRASGIQRLFLPYVALQALADSWTNSEAPDSFDHGQSELREIITAGEQLRITPQIEQFVRGLRVCRIQNQYGPTETHVTTTFSLPLNTSEWRPLPSIGRPLANTRIYLLDSAGEPQPIGVHGEIHIGGVALARAYLNRPDLTAERFIHDPFSDEPEARMYRTGDLARYLPDGNLEFLGRSDFQVKIRGFRIELGEIEARLGACEGVREAVVLAREDAPGDKRLVAYYTARDAANDAAMKPTAPGPGPGPGADALREQLAAQLPEYMVPAAFVVLPALPLSPNGKVDRKALPSPDSNAFASRAFEAPLGEIETTLARNWGEVLGLERIGRRDNFFELGGHSLMATQVVSRIRRDWGIAQPVRAIFENPTLERLASRLRIELNNGIERRADVVPPKRIAAREVPLPTSFSQRRMWLVQQLNPKTTAYNISLSLHLLGALNGEAMVSALQTVTRRHEAFRMRFVAVDGEPMQLIASELAVHVERIDLRDAPQELRRTLARERVADIVSQPFDLSVAGLHRIALLCLGNQEHVLLWTMHHAIGDQWSFGILLRELRQVYGSLLNGSSQALPVLELDYSDFAAWQREQASSAANQLQLAYWRRRLADVKPLALPTDLPRYGPLQGRGGGVQMRLQPALIERLKQVSRSRGATPFMTLLACFKVLMARISGQHDIAVATPIANRLGIHSESLVGTLVNTLVMRSDLSGDPPFAELLKQVQETALQAYANQDTSFDQLVEEIQTPRDMLRAPLVQVMFNLVNAPFSLSNFAALKVEPFEFEKRAAQFELSIAVDLDAFGELHLSYASELFTRATAQRLLGSFMTLVEGVLADPSRRIGEYDLLGSTQRLELAHWNETDRPRSRYRNLAELLGANAAHWTARVALQDLQTTLSYAKLEAESNRLARALRARGVSRGALVGLCVERTCAMVVAQLAILKAGAAYVPLDPAYPSERLAMMAADAQLALLVTESANLQALKWPRSNSLWLDGDAPSIAVHDDTALAPILALDAGPEDPAYVIYTSGSTGRPKGVVVPHRAVLNFLVSMARKPGLCINDRVLAVTTLSFDIAVLELLLPLSVGATIILASADQALDGRALRACLEKNEATVMQATPSTWRMLVEAGWKGAPGFKALIGGEALPPDLANALLERVDELWNMYGPTETTVWSTCWRVVQPEAGICIGRPIANTQVHVLDEAGQQCPIGVPGEICIGGEGVALGYLHRSELTDERFLPDRFSANSKARFYRTGDLGRWRYDGQLEHMGRLDHQVKIRGHRIELGEIEANLGSHAGVARAVVIVREDRTGDQRISAYVVPRGAMPAPAELRDHLRATLPQYMLPQHYVSLDSVPLLPNGKLDRARLPQPGDAVNEPRVAVTPLDSPEERAIAEVWQRLLAIDGVERNDNFFDLGGHSLLAVRAASEIEAAIGLHLSPRRLIFETLAQLAAKPPAAVAAAVIPPRERTQPSLRNKLVGGFRRLLRANRQ